MNKLYNVYHFLLVFQYISANPNVQGAYIPQYPPMQAVPVSILDVYLITVFFSVFCLEIIVVLQFY